jgi:PQQ-like domain
MKINSKNNNVLDFKLFDSNCLIKTLDNKIYVNDNFISDDVSSFLGVGNIIYFTKNKILHSFDIISNNLKIEIFPIPSLDIQNDKYLNLSDFEIIPNNYACNYYINEYSFPFGQLISKTKNKYTIGYGVWIDPVFYFCNSEIEITSLHLPTETTLWQLSVADLGASKVSKIMGVFGQVLVVVAEMQHPLYSDRDQFIELYMGLDIHTGQVIWKTSHFINTAGVQQYFMSWLNRWHFNTDSRTIQALLLYDYVQLDTQTGQIMHVQDLKSEATRINASFFQSTDFQNDHLYFRAVDEAVGGFASMIGAYNIHSHTVKWHYRLYEHIKNGALRNNTPTVAGNKIYAHDTGNTLHILEMEEEK